LEIESPTMRKTLSLRETIPLLLALAVIGLSGCATTDRMKTSSIPMDDYRKRHPIVMAETAQKLDLFPSPEIQGLDRRTAEQVAEFAQLYRISGEGPITIFVPTGGHVPVSRDTVPTIRLVLAQNGVRAQIAVMRYPVGNPGLASPVRLSFIGLKAKVADPCGQWPRDLASGSSTDGWENKPYWNMGCAYQNMLAEQVADPRDLVAPRAEDPADTQVEARPIDNLRKGTDPTTDWKTKNTSISSVGSQ
jgi:pilus assembly protein CpaD